MRKVILYMHVTLDGFVEGRNGDMTWLNDDDQLWDELFTFLVDVDLFVLGAGMWNDYRNYWKKALVDPTFTANEIRYARLAEKTQHIVFSKTIKNAGWESATVNSGSAVDEIQKLKHVSGRNIQIVGGARFATTLIDSGVVDEYRILINPSIIGGGKSFFHHLSTRHSLTVSEVRKFDNGTVLLVYASQQR